LAGYLAFPLFIGYMISVCSANSIAKTGSAGRNRMGDVGDWWLHLCVCFGVFLLGWSWTGAFPSFSLGD